MTLFNYNDTNFKKVYMDHIDWAVAQEENSGTAVKAAANKAQPKIKISQIWPTLFDLL